jgi:creatinine amidohydrolase/Fe(II)-dependent formamide hydrolase-like protein
MSAGFLSRMIVLLLLLAPLPAFAAAPSSVFLEELTWTELRAQIHAGKTTIIIPVGGVEQSGPYMALGKHDVRARWLSERIARGLGNALVAPVVAYVPEGSLNPPTGHLRFPGTITVPSDVFRRTIESAAMSFKLHGFTDVVLIGDHGGYQSDLRQAADELNRAWAHTPVRAHYIAAYYQATQTAYVAALKSRGYGQGEIGTHAGLADTSLMLAVDSRQVRPEVKGARASVALGMYGDPHRASAALGAIGINEIIRQTTQAIQAAVRRR